MELWLCAIVERSYKPITMAESHKSNGNDVTFLVIVSGVVAVGIVALYHSSGCMELECCDVRPSYRFHGDVSSILIGGFRNSV